MPQKVWSRDETIAFINATGHAIQASGLTGQARALLVADRDGAEAYLRYLDVVEAERAAKAG